MEAFLLWWRPHRSSQIVVIARYERSFIVIFGMPLHIENEDPCRSELEKQWPCWSFTGVNEEIWWLSHAEDKSDPKKVIEELDGMLLWDLASYLLDWRNQSGKCNHFMALPSPPPKPLPFSPYYLCTPGRYVFKSFLILLQYAPCCSSCSSKVWAHDHPQVFAY